MKTKNEYLTDQGINLEKDFDIATYTKLRFAMEQYGIDYHKAEVKKLNLARVSQQSELLDLVKEIASDKQIYSNTRRRLWAKQLIKSPV